MGWVGFFVVMLMTPALGFFYGGLAQRKNVLATIMHSFFILALISVPVVLLAIVGVEFLIDRSELGKLFSYALYLLALAVPAVLGMLMLNMEVQLGQGID